MTEAKPAQSAVRSTAHGVLDNDAVWAMVEASPDGTLLVDRDGLIVFANRQAELLFGYDRAELSGQSVDRLLPEELRGVHRAHRLRFTAEPALRSMGQDRLLWARRADGSKSPVEIALSPVVVAGQTCSMPSVRDITERRYAEAQARELLRLLDGTRDGVCVAAPDTLRFEYVNDGVCALTGYSRAELLQMTAAHLLVCDPVELTGALAPLLSGEVSVMRRDWVLRRCDGVDIAVEIDVTFPVREDGERRLVGIARDVTERCGLEAEREAIRVQLADVLALTRVRVRRADTDGTITLAQGAPSGHFGPVAALVGQNIYDIADFPESLMAFEQRVVASMSSRPCASPTAGL